MQSIVSDRYTATGAAKTAEILTSTFSPAVLRLLAANDCKFVPIGDALYADASPALRRLAAGVDRWPVPPAGLFVCEERTVYLRAVTPMPVVHEAGHALDSALGGGVYLSSIDARFRRAFKDATAFVTPYAASSLDEYFAESSRAWFGVNDAVSLWPSVSRERLAKCDPTMYALLEEIFERIERDDTAARAGEQMTLFAA